MSDWERTGATVCVVCPDCAFTFDAAHENGDGTGYSCPLCGEQRAERERDEARVELAEARCERDEALARAEGDSRAMRAEREIEALRAVAEAARVLCDAVYTLAATLPHVMSDTVVERLTLREALTALDAAKETAVRASVGSSPTAGGGQS